MTKYFEQKEAAEAPKESGVYPTNRVYFYYDVAKNAWREEELSEWEYLIEWWMEPVEPKGLTLEEAKEQAAQSFGFKKYSHIEFLGGPGSASLVDMKAEIIYLSSNTAALREENERKDSLIETAVKTSFLKDDEIKKLEQKVKTLTEALEGVVNLKLLIEYPKDLDPEQVGEAQAIAAMYSKIETALSLTK